MQHEEGEGGAEKDGGQVALPAAPGHRLLPLGALTLQQRALVGESGMHRNIGINSSIGQWRVRHALEKG